MNDISTEPVREEYSGLEDLLNLSDNLEVKIKTDTLDDVVSKIANKLEEAFKRLDSRIDDTEEVTQDDIVQVKADFLSLKKEYEKNITEINNEMKEMKTSFTFQVQDLKDKFENFSKLMDEKSNVPSTDLTEDNHETPKHTSSDGIDAVNNEIEHIKRKMDLLANSLDENIRVTQQIVSKMNGTVKQQTVSSENGNMSNVVQIKQLSEIQAPELLSPEQNCEDTDQAKVPDTILHNDNTTHLSTEISQEAPVLEDKSQFHVTEMRVDDLLSNVQYLLKFKKSSEEKQDSVVKTMSSVIGEMESLKSDISAIKLELKSNSSDYSTITEKIADITSSFEKSINSCSETDKNIVDQMMSDRKIISKQFSEIKNAVRSIPIQQLRDGFSNNIQIVNNNTKKQIDYIKEQLKELRDALKKSDIEVSHVATEPEEEKLDLNSMELELPHLIKSDYESTEALVKSSSREENLFPEMNIKLGSVPPSQLDFGASHSKHNSEYLHTSEAKSEIVFRPYNIEKGTYTTTESQTDPYTADRYSTNTQCSKVPKKSALPMFQPKKTRQTSDSAKESSNTDRKNEPHVSTSSSASSNSQNTLVKPNNLQGNISFAAESRGIDAKNKSERQRKEHSTSELARSGSYDLCEDDNVIIDVVKRVEKLENKVEEIIKKPAKVTTQQAVKNSVTGESHVVSTQAQAPAPVQESAYKFDAIDKTDSSLHLDIPNHVDEKHEAVRDSVTSVRNISLTPTSATSSKKLENYTVEQVNFVPNTETFMVGPKGNTITGISSSSSSRLNTPLSGSRVKSTREEQVVETPNLGQPEERNDSIQIVGEKFEIKIIKDPWNKVTMNVNEESNAVEPISESPLQLSENDNVQNQIHTEKEATKANSYCFTVNAVIPTAPSVSGRLKKFVEDQISDSTRQDSESHDLQEGTSISGLNEYEDRVFRLEKRLNELEHSTNLIRKAKEVREGHRYHHKSSSRESSETRELRKEKDKERVQSKERVSRSRRKERHHVESKRKVSFDNESDTVKGETSEIHKTEENLQRTSSSKIRKSPCKSSIDSNAVQVQAQKKQHAVHTTPNSKLGSQESLSAPLSDDKDEITKRERRLSQLVEMSPRNKHDPNEILNSSYSSYEETDSDTFERFEEKFAIFRDAIIDLRSKMQSVSNELLENKRIFDEFRIESQSQMQNIQTENPETNDSSSVVVAIKKNLDDYIQNNDKTVVDLRSEMHQLIQEIQNSLNSLIPTLNKHTVKLPRPDNQPLQTKQLLNSSDSQSKSHIQAPHTGNAEKKKLYSVHPHTESPRILDIRPLETPNFTRPHSPDDSSDAPIIENQKYTTELPVEAQKARRPSLIDIIKAVESNDGKIPNGLIPPQPAPPEPSENGDEVGFKGRNVPQPVRDITVTNAIERHAILETVIPYIIDLRTEILLKVDTANERTREAEVNLNNKCDKDYIEAFFRKLRVQFNKLAEKVEKTSNALSDRVAHEEMQNAFDDLYRLLTRETSTPAGTKGVNCLFCGKPTNTIAGMITDPNVVESIGNPNQPKGRTGMIFGIDKNVYRGKTTFGRGSISLKKEIPPLKETNSPSTINQ